jgi:hypothetical protein
MTNSPSERNSIVQKIGTILYIFLFISTILLVSLPFFYNLSYYSMYIFIPISYYLYITNTIGIGFHMIFFRKKNVQRLQKMIYFHFILSFLFFLGFIILLILQLLMESFDFWIIYEIILDAVFFTTHLILYLVCNAFYKRMKNLQEEENFLETETKEFENDTKLDEDILIKREI